MLIVAVINASILIECTPHSGRCDEQARSGEKVPPEWEMDPELGASRPLAWRPNARSAKPNRAPSFSLVESLGFELLWKVKFPARHVEFRNRFENQVGIFKTYRHCQKIFHLEQLT